MKYAVIWTDGEMTNQQVLKECPDNQFVPLFALYDEQGNPTIVLFEHQSVGLQFIKRNVPKGWPQALFQLSDDDMDKMPQLGWKTELWSFPRKIQNLKHGFEVYEIVDKPEVRRMGKA